MSRLLVGIIVIILTISACEAASNQPNGECAPQLWPLPESYTSGTSYSTISPTFSIEYMYQDGSQPDGDHLQRLHSISEIHERIIFPHPRMTENEKHWTSHINHNNQVQTSITKLIVELSPTFTYAAPSLMTNESYTLQVNETTGLIQASSISGVNYGLKTFSQLVLYANSSITSWCDEYPVTGYFIPNLPWIISDAPRFKWRGMLVDTSRHFLPLPLLKNVVDGLSFTKMNVLHVHFVDAQSFPVQFNAPLDNLAKKGAYSNSEQYSIADLRGLQYYAADRGVRILAEFDSPGHTYAWSFAYPELVVCPNVQPNWGTYCAEPPCGQLDPSNNDTYSLLSELFLQANQIFTDDYLHLGYDEVNFNCWNSAPSVVKFMQDNHLNNTQLLQYYFDRQLKLVPSQKTPVYWEEVITSGITIPGDVVVQVWNTKATYRDILYNYTNPVLLSNHDSWYLDCGTGSFTSRLESWCPYATWQTVYLNEPFSDIVNPTFNVSRAYGGEVALWGEEVDQTNLLSKAFPRAAAAGERLWSPRHVRDTLKALPRLLKHRQYLVERGIGAAPLQPQWCNYNPHDCYPGNF